MTKTFTPSRPIWCAGCGDFGVLHALIGGFEELGVGHELRYSWNWLFGYFAK